MWGRKGVEDGRGGKWRVRDGRDGERLGVNKVDGR